MANLAQLKQLEDLDGFLLLDKPQGLPMATIIKTVKRKFNLVKVGHGGSLEALSSGLLVLLINGANRLVGEVMGADRAYAGRMRLGLSTDTHDVQGRTVRGPEIVTELIQARALASVLTFRGDIFQTESRFCSVRREITAGYEIADTGDHRPFLTHVYRFELMHFAWGEKPSIDFELSGTKNLLVRTLVNDFGDAIGCGACLESLRRLRIGKFSVDQAIPFDRLLALNLGDFASCVKPVGTLLQ